MASGRHPGLGVGRRLLTFCCFSGAASGEPLLPDRTSKRGDLWRDHRQLIDAIAFKYRTGTPWMDLSERFGLWVSTHSRQVAGPAPSNCWTTWRASS
ncbi:transposase [Kitasatospora sp. NPDC098663]|uniref:transposase n=1 Tax=Kitasatospora sp. NPDC098663 TaxID=3364096 RepID=UPI003823DD53